MIDADLPPKEKDIFNQTVWKIVRLIPEGRVATYGQIAGYIPCPAGISAENFKLYRARWAGNAMAASPQGVPWQRVINAQGKISIRSGAETQRKLLGAEGVVFDARERIDLKRYGWDGPTYEWLQENGLVTPDEPRQANLFF